MSTTTQPSAAREEGPKRVWPYIFIGQIDNGLAGMCMVLNRIDGAQEIVAPHAFDDLTQRGHVAPHP
jgi:hypothetical protein